MEYTGIRVMLPDPIKVNTFAGIITAETGNLQKDTEYILQFKIINYTSINVLDHIVYIKDGVSTLISNNINITSFPLVNTFTDEGITKNEYLCHVKFTVPKDGKYKFAICRTVTNSDRSGKAFDIREVSCEKGSTLQDFKDNTKDLQDFIKKCEVYFEQTDNKISMLARKEDVKHSEVRTQSKLEVSGDNILLEVKKQVNDTEEKFEKTTNEISSELKNKVDEDSIISSINMSPEKIQINSNLIDMTGSLDLNGTFTCYKDGSNKTGHYLYQSGAIHRGYLQGMSNPTFSSGIWRPDGVNDMGYVSVGWTNSDHIDENGCLWLSPIAGGGGQLIYSRLLDTGVGSVSGIQYYKTGEVDYMCAINNKQNDGIFGHRFDSGVSCHSIHSGPIYSDSTLKVNNQVYTDNSDLFLSAGGYNATYRLYLNNGGYFNPVGHVQLGTGEQPFYKLISTYAPTITSDKRKKVDIQYIDDVLSLSENEANNETISCNDMYEYVKNIKLATYKLRNSKEEDKNNLQLGFIAQDVVDTKVGKLIVDSSDKDNLVYDLANRISVLEGALQVAIKKIEELESLGN